MNMNEMYNFIQDMQNSRWDLIRLIPEAHNATYQNKAQGSQLNEIQRIVSKLEEQNREIENEISKIRQSNPQEGSEELYISKVLIAERDLNLHKIDECKTKFPRFFQSPMAASPSTRPTSMTMTNNVQDSSLSFMVNDQLMFDRQPIIEAYKELNPSYEKQKNPNIFTFESGGGATNFFKSQAEKGLTFLFAQLDEKSQPTRNIVLGVAGKFYEGDIGTIKEAVREEWIAIHDAMASHLDMDRIVPQEPNNPFSKYKLDQLKVMEKKYSAILYDLDRLDVRSPKSTQDETKKEEEESSTLRPS